MAGAKDGAVRCSDRDADGCRFHRLVPLARGEAVRVVSADPPAGSDVTLQIHERTLLGDRGSTIAREGLDTMPTLRAPLSGWYRLELRVPGARPERIVRTCVELAD